MSIGDETVLVPPLDPDVYKQDLDNWDELLVALHQDWQTIQTRDFVTNSFLDLAQSTLTDRVAQISLETALLDKTRHAEANALAAWTQAHNELALRRSLLNDAELTFKNGIISWERDETNNAAFSLAFNCANLLFEVGKLVATVVFAPPLGLQSTVDLAVATLNAAPVVLNDATTAAGSQSAVVEDKTVTVSPPEKEAEEKDPTAFEQAEAYAESIDAIAGQGAEVVDSVDGVVTDVKRLIEIGQQADALRREAQLVSAAVDTGLGATGQAELQGIDIVTGGKQTWDHLEININYLFEFAMANYTEIEGGPAFRDAFRHLLVAARTVCDATLTLAAAKNERSIAELRQEMARKGKITAEQRIQELEAQSTWDQTLAQLLFNRIIDNKRTIYLLCEQYRRALQYYTLEYENLPDLPDMSTHYTQVKEKVNLLTSLQWKLENLDVIPRVMNGIAYQVDAVLQQQLGDAQNRYLAVFDIP
ncbi:MAG: hypothetical protein KDC44_05330, partial [Phaeodactylibacter sp.]|nr:hypothetical protein [Phaeodactylibacter sp.]